MTRFAALLSFLVLVAAPPHGAAQPVEPPDALRRALADHTVSVRVWDAEASTELETGSGFIVADDGATLTIVTAEHVVASARAGAGQAQVRFPGSDRWAAATLAEPLAGAGESAERDIAALSAPREGTPYGAARLGAGMAILPPARSGDRVWAFGLDTERDALVWRQGLADASDPSGLARFAAEGIQPGYSGGALAGPQGIIGMVISMGPAGMSHLAIPFERVADALTEMKQPCSLRRNPALSAIRHAFDQKLAIGVWAVRVLEDGDGHTFWAGLTLTALNGDAFEGRAFTTHGSGGVSLRPQGGALDMTLIDGLGAWPPHARVEPGTVSLVPDEERAIDGFMVLRGQTGDATVYVGVPTQRAELFAARALIGAVQHGALRANLRDAGEHLFNAETRQAAVGGAAPPLALAMGGEEPIRFVVPALLHRDRVVRLVARPIVPDIFRRDAKDEFRDNLLASNLAVFTEPASGGRHAISAENFRERNLELAFTVPQAPAAYLGIMRRGNDRTHDRYVLLQYLVLRYE